MGQFFDELKRRNVFRVAIAYLVSAWLVLQVADIVLEGIGAPGWVMKALILFGALGFPFVLVFSWAYELTPEGIRKEADVDRSHSITHETGRKLDIVTIGMLVAVIGVVIIERMFFHEDHGEAPMAAATIAPEKSIAVLAFDDLSPEGDHAYFAEGLSEELLNVLAQVGDLQVAGRTSSFAFKSQDKDLREIGELLNVAHILEGSVRRAGNRIRVTAQLINTSDGYHLFSETYDRELEDVFAVQDEIAQEISNALLSEIVGTETVTAARTDTEAYELYLGARQRIHTRDIVLMREADRMLSRALEVDPLYAPALAQKALVTMLMSNSQGSYGDIPFDEALEIARPLIDQALALSENLAEAHAVRGMWLDTANRDSEAVAPLERALALNPTMSDAANWLWRVLDAEGRAKKGLTILEDVVSRDPTYGPAFGNLTWQYMRNGQYDDAAALVDRVTHIVGVNDDVRQSRGIMAVMRGEPAKAVEELRLGIAANPNATVMQAFYCVALMGVADYETVLHAGLPEYRMLAYALSGRTEEALRVLEDIDLAAGARSRALRNLSQALISVGQPGRYVNYVNDRYGSIDDLLSDESTSRGPGAGYLLHLAYAYRQKGDEDTSRRLMDMARADLDQDRALGDNNWIVDIDDAIYFALAGNQARTVAAVEIALDNGLSAAHALDSPVFHSLRDHPAFEALKQRLADHVDAERAKLGMPPYRPIPTTDEERPAFVH